VHHIIDPASSKPVPAIWDAVSVAAGSCLDANIASCAAMVMGARAVGWLERLGLPARLLACDGPVVTVAGWPAEEATSCC
jgi:thiamine biosynthesis lipoprotein